AARATRVGVVGQRRAVALRDLGGPRGQVTLAAAEAVYVHSAVDHCPLLSVGTLRARIALTPCSLERSCRSLTLTGYLGSAGGDRARGRGRGLTPPAPGIRPGPQS